MQVMFIIANNEFLAKNFASKFQEEKARIVYSTPEEEIHDRSYLSKIVTSWQDGNITRTITLDDLDDSKINIIIIPYAALAFTSILARRFGTSLEFVIVALKESIQTQAITTDLYDLYIDISCDINEIDFNYYFSRRNNVFEESRFDIIKTLLTDGKIYGISAYNNYLTQ